MAGVTATSYEVFCAKKVDSRLCRSRKLPEVIYNVQLKTRPDFDDVYNSKPEELVDLVMAIIKNKNIGNRFYIQSFDK